MTGLPAAAAGAPTTLLAPHLDDAVFSAWHALVGPGAARVATVFAGLPPEGTLTPLDRAHGAQGSAAWVRRRRAEDAAVLGAIGASVVHLDLLDVQYRAEAVPRLRAAVEADAAGFVSIVEGAAELAVGPEELEAAVAGLGPLAKVLAPIGIGGHPDHVAVARFAAGLRGTGAEVTLWADAPYFLRHGPPSCATGRANQAADALVAGALESLALPGDLRPEVVVLTASQVQAKLTAIRGYRTELAGILEDFGPLATDAEAMALELRWTLGP